MVSVEVNQNSQQSLDLDSFPSWVESTSFIQVKAATVLGSPNVTAANAITCSISYFGIPIPWAFRTLVCRVEESKNYYGIVPQPNGKRKAVPLCPDFAISKQILDKLLTDAALLEHGIADVFGEHKKKRLTDHLKDFRQALLANNNTEKYARQTVLLLNHFVWMDLILPLPSKRVTQSTAEKMCNRCDPTSLNDRRMYTGTGRNAPVTPTEF